MNHHAMRFASALFAIGCVIAAATVEAAGEKTPSPEPAAVTDLDPKSIYQLDAAWRSADGRELQLRDLRGKPRVITLFYSTCQSACPVIVGRMKSVQAALPAEMRDNTGFVLVSMDPSVDRPEKLLNYRRELELEGDWLLLHGDDSSIRELAALLGFRYRQEKDGGYSHSNMITVLDRQGRIAHQSTGLEPDLQQMVEAVKKTLQQ
jgi:protein SCO1